MPDQNSYAESVSALDKLRQKHIVAGRTEKNISNVFKGGVEGAIIASPLNPIVKQIAAGSLEDSGKSEGELTAERKENQLARLEQAAKKTYNNLLDVHNQMKSGLNDDSVSPDETHSLAARASMLRNKLYYFQDVGKDIDEGFNARNEWTWMSHPIAYGEFKGSPEAAAQLRQSNPTP